MGKRRDRRQQQASSRRVKLDLSTEDVLSPSETPGPSEVLGSTLGEDVKAGARTKEAANDNPLSLLGQYSDDEADEDDNPGAGPTHIMGDETGDDFARSPDEQENAEATLVPEKNLDEMHNTSSPGLGHHKQDSKSFAESETTMQFMAKAENEWQAVLHEETGEYYYWNIQTGETTWVKPVSLEIRNAGELGSPGNVTVDVDLSSVKRELVQREKHRNADQGEPGELESILKCENVSPRVEIRVLQPSQDAEAGDVKTCLESTASLEPELDSLKRGTKFALDTTSAEEKSQGSKDPECRTGSDDATQGPDKKKVEGDETDKKTLVPVKLDGEDVDSEAMEPNQGASEGSLAHENKFEEDNTKSCDRNFAPAGESLQETELGNTTSSDLQDASEHPVKSNTRKTLQEKMVSFAERGDALQQRLNALARDSLGGVSRHAHMALQSEARINDWKAFCALGFDPEACFSFMQDELTQLESVLMAEEAIGQKVVQSTTALEASREVRPGRNDADWSLNWGYYQQESSTLPELWKQGQPTEFLGTAEDVEEGEIQTSYGEVHAAYSSISEGLTAVNNVNMSNLAGSEDVDMDVDMDVDDDNEAEPAVPGLSSDVPSQEASVSYTYPYSLRGSNDVGTLAPVDSSLGGDPTHYFSAGLPGDSWAPPLPPDDEWAPPPPGETEPVPPPPPDEPPPLPPDAPGLAETLFMPSVPPEIQVHYSVPEYTLVGNNQHSCIPEYQSALDASMYGAYVEDVPGVVYSNSAQFTDLLKVEQPYLVASVSSSAFNGWSAPVMATTALSLANPVSASEAPVKSSIYVPSVSTPSSVTTDSSAGGTVSEAKKPVTKGKVKKRTHAVAAAPMLNKKVSNLVNKWKQAKEELHGGEEDEDDKALYDLEVLEKKRQKEIEEWRRQQIASGDALDNANFQPLGTIDWRERVKRAKKADPKEGKERDTGSEASLPTLEDQNQEALKSSQKPNLAGLCKGLPAGWQAYWDEASGEVYYGNLNTQETTWDRPVT